MRQTKFWQTIVSTKCFLKYTAGSVVSSVVEEVLFLAMTALLNDSLAGFALTIVPLLVARALASLVQFRFNQKLVFCSRGATGKALLRFFILTIPVTVAQLVLTYGSYSLFSITEEQVLLRGAVYAGVMVVLFVVSFLFQRSWVFAAEKAQDNQ